jgi:hypothetical protein
MDEPTEQATPRTREMLEAIRVGDFERAATLAIETDEVEELEFDDER